MPVVASLSASHLLVTAGLLTEIKQADFSQLCILSASASCVGIGILTSSYLIRPFH